jgi:hypothetical protein
MKLCGKCGKTPLPYVIVLFIGSISAFVTWLTLPLLGVPAELHSWLTAATFLLITVMLLTYMFSCIRRHCTHQDKHHSAHHSRHHGIAHG